MVSATPRLPRLKILLLSHFFLQDQAYIQRRPQGRKVQRNSPSITRPQPLLMLKQLKILLRVCILVSLPWV